MDPRAADELLAQSAARRQQTIDAGTARWTGKAVWSLCSAALALGVLVDAGMIWLWVLLMLMGVGVAWRSGVRLPRTPASTRWHTWQALSWVLVGIVWTAAQIPARLAEFPFPNTVSAAAACLVIVFVCRPVQARLAESLRP